MTTPVGAAGPHLALLVVDMQVDFGAPEGSLYVEGAQDLLPEVNRLVAQVDTAGGHVLYTQDTHPAQTPHFVTSGGLWPPHGVVGTPGAALLPGLQVLGPVVRKGVDGSDGYSGFSVRDPTTGSSTGTVLDGMLRERGVRQVVVVGLAGDYCVGETALDAVRLGYGVTLPLALTRFVGRQPDDADAMVDRCRQAGVRVLPG